MVCSSALARTACVLLALAGSATAQREGDLDYQRQLAERFAPRFFFDQSGAGYCLPESATNYYNARKANPNHGSCNEGDAARDMINRGDVEAYYHISFCSNTDKDAVISYWIWYGDQRSCGFGQGTHRGDWEHVTVRVVNDKMHSVNFKQHGGHYTRYRDSVSRTGEHVHAYIGKTSHGSYHNECDTDRGCPGGCFYYDDFRNNNNGGGAIMDTWKNLVHLTTGPNGLPWMRDTGTDIFGITHPLGRGTDHCNWPGCKQGCTPFWGIGCGKGGKGGCASDYTQMGENSWFIQGSASRVVEDNAAEALEAPSSSEADAPVHGVVGVVGAISGAVVVLVAGVAIFAYRRVKSQRAAAAQPPVAQSVVGPPQP